MPERELETVVWCSTCRNELGRVYRVPTGSEGVYQHQSIPEEIPKACPNCGEVTRRKP